MPPCGRWKSRATSRAGSPGCPSSRSSKSASFGPTPGSAAAGAKNGSRIEGRSDIAPRLALGGDGSAAALCCTIPPPALAGALRLHSQHETVWLGERRDRDVPSPADLVDHVDRESPLPVHDLRSPRSRPENLPEFLLRATHLGDR